VLSSDAYRDDVEADIAQAERIGGRGVPLFVFGGRYAVSGAQPADVFAQALDRAWRDGGIVDIAGSDAAACGPDGCELPTHRPGN
ncbi:TPA: DsbA family protein, partial [Burkholderia dolosa]